MLQRIINQLSILPRWIIIIIDLAVITFSTLIGYLLRFNFHWLEIKAFHPVYGILTSVSCWLGVTLITKSYSGIVRYTGIEDGIRLAYTSFLSLLAVCTLNLLYYYNANTNLIPYSVLFTAFPISFFFLFFYRLFVKAVFSYYKSGVQVRNNVLIFGAGQLGIAVKQIIDTNPSNRLKVAAFLEDDVRKAGKEMQGTKIFHTSDLQLLLKKLDAKELIIAVNGLSLDRKNQLVEECLRFKVRVRSVPPVEKWVRGELDLRQIREVNIEDLLGRESIQIDNDQVRKDIYHKSVCITGAGGSIGRELARQVIQYEPSVLILIDQAETPLYEIEHELRSNKMIPTRVLVFVADISNQDRIKYIFEECKPELVFHAAAYKHVPMMESNPSEAVTTNIFGTKILADVSAATGVRRFVMVSTDKAVNPTNVMGCTKRIAEIYVQSLNVDIEKRGNGSISFITTRFGNVLGSNGSVIPMFKKQIESGGPVTVTHPDITRYFMTIPEACRLVMEAGVMGKGGEIFIFDMGKPIKIYDLAKKMVMLSGLELGKDIDIIFTGLREGEKLFEELLNDAENTIPTYHEKIMRAKVAEYRYHEISNFIDLLQDLVNDRNELKMVALMKEIVPEFKSNYSRYEILDRDN